MKIAIIGVGLIGGSMALKLREKGLASYVYGIDSNEEHLREAKKLGIIDESSSLENGITNANLIIIAIPVDAARHILPSVLDLMNEKQTVMDVGSTKAGITEAIKNHSKDIDMLPLTLCGAPKTVAHNLLLKILLVTEQP